MNLKDTYNKIAEDYYEDHKKETWAKEDAKKFGKMFKKGDLILDLFNKPFFVKEKEIDLSVSIGIASCKELLLSERFTEVMVPRGETT